MYENLLKGGMGYVGRGGEEEEERRKYFIKLTSKPDFVAHQVALIVCLYRYDPRSLPDPEPLNVIEVVSWTLHSLVVFPDILRVVS